ncbi:endonuclease/exonuclease/phosphatase family protein [Aurantiacibacter sp. MUD11]|uniref:endonuclease/exonuclease/phosphatase family protein n=1 Tax=Aurantiacibacter sp. MUD11 TaxID=3003265 RepID=UPI0022AAD72C|nr:endonuclease/exonuclease/phosphatase family protein [Aurantiacibacter sp. MUD11]WAT18928.1 endonuclease/exonuclease/phosphatase family protein [Aurantiacibacter sp. MUD11]
MRIATFNVQRLRLRQHGDTARFDGANDGDNPRRAATETPALDRMDRELTAAVIRQLDADVIALQEVFDQRTLDRFHEDFLQDAGVEPWPHRVCLPGNDGRGFDVALMSRLPLSDVRSHADVTCADLGLEPLAGHGPDERIFRRDCLRARVGPLTFYVCHFKAPYPDKDRSYFLRRREAEAVRMLVERDMAGRDDALWLIAGDLNEPLEVHDNGEPAIAPLLAPGFAVDLVHRIPDSERWSFRDPASGTYSHPDALLASPALAATFPDAVPTLLRGGMELDVTRYSGPHLAGVGQTRPHASDHAALAVDFAGL